MPEKKEKENWVTKLGKGVKYFLSGEAMMDKAKQENREKRLKEIKAKLAAKEKAKKKKPEAKNGRTLRTKRVESGSAKGDFDKMRGNY